MSSLRLICAVIGGVAATGVLIWALTADLPVMATICGAGIAVAVAWIIELRRGRQRA